MAYDVRTDGSVAAWGETRPAPVPVGGSEVSLLVGPADPEAVRTRARSTDRFRAAAETAQARQSRIFARARPPAPAPAVDPAALADDVRAGIDPETTVPDTVSARLALAAPIDPAAVGDPLQPLALTPRYLFPTFELFRDAFQDRLFPGASTIPDDSVTALCVNRSALESFLVGMNHEMSRELLWRGFPLRHGTYFGRFWDADADDVLPVEGWGDRTRLGGHAPGGGVVASLLLVVRAELVRRIPSVTVYAAPAKPGASGAGRTVDFAARVDPLFSGRLEPDVRFFGFPLTAPQARGPAPRTAGTSSSRSTRRRRASGSTSPPARTGATPPPGPGWTGRTWPRTGPPTRRSSTPTPAPRRACAGCCWPTRRGRS